MSTVASRFLDKYGLKFFAEQIDVRMNSELSRYFNDRIVQIIDENSLDSTVPSAEAVWGFVSDLIKESIGVNFEVWEGDLEDGHPLFEGGAEPVPGTIYLVKVDDPEHDNLYTQWIYHVAGGSGRWINLGQTKCDLSGVWTHDDLVALTTGDIEEILTEVWPDLAP